MSGLRTVCRSLVALAVIVSLVACSKQQPPRFQFAERGVNVYVSTDKFKDDQPQAITDRANELFDYALDLGANSVALFIPIFTDGPKGSSVARQYKTPSNVLLRLVVQSAQERHLRVKFRPAIDQDNLVSSGDWRGNIQPANGDQWFATYLDTLRPLLQVAEDTHAEEFQIGLELDSLEGDPHWATAVSTARSLYHGKLTYSVHWEPFAAHSEHSPTPDFGVTAYPPFDLPDDASVAKLQTAWNKWLDNAGAGRDLSKIALDEVGIPSAPGMYHKPYSWDTKGMKYLPHVQQRWFEAACKAAKAHHVPGFYVWKLDFFGDPSQARPDNDPPTSFVRRPGEQAIRTCFKV